MTRVRAQKGFWQNDNLGAILTSGKYERAELVQGLEQIIGYRSGLDGCDPDVCAGSGGAGRGHDVFSQEGGPKAWYKDGARI